MKIVAVMHGGATAASLENSRYREKFQRDNSNIKLSKALKRAGVSSTFTVTFWAHNGFASEGYALVE